jgi:hypothetical protein
VRGAALVAIDEQAGLRARHRLERASSIPAHQQAPPRVVARRADDRRIEVLRDEHVLVAVAVEISDARVKRRGELRFPRQGHGLEAIAAIDERHVTQGDRRLLPGPGLQRPKYAVHRCVGECGECAESFHQIGNRDASARIGVVRRESANTRILSRQQRLLLAAGADRSVHEHQRGSAVRRRHGVASPARRDQIEPAVAVQVARRQTIPATRPAIQPPGCGRARECAAIVEEENDGVPLAREQQIRVTVAVDVGKHGRGDEADVREERRRGRNKRVAVVAQQ